jgi:hydrogenase maturation protease
MTSERIRVLAVGSPHGDDQVGWEIVARLHQRIPSGVEARTLSEPLELLDHLDGCDRLIVLDACRSGGKPGTTCRFRWPDERLDWQAGGSSHGLGVAAALSLAVSLGRTIPEVVLFGIEGRNWAPGEGLGPEVSEALPLLVEEVLAELRGARP